MNVREEVIMSHDSHVWAGHRTSAPFLDFQFVKSSGHGFLHMEDLLPARHTQHTGSKLDRSLTRKSSSLQIRTLSVEFGEFGDPCRLHLLQDGLLSFVEQLTQPVEHVPGLLHHFVGPLLHIEGQPLHLRDRRVEVRYTEARSRQRRLESLFVVGAGVFHETATMFCMRFRYTLPASKYLTVHAEKLEWDATMSFTGRAETRRALSVGCRGQESRDGFQRMVRLFGAMCAAVI
mmetsp:Transcript_35679/g.82891  ORF Transcript_35679/g.82891 Transcript_35679/m.82891 type:complete len:233 (+) Transcript_35679:120-818(+)